MIPLLANICQHRAQMCRAPRRAAARRRATARRAAAVRFDETTLFVGEIPNKCHYTYGCQYCSALAYASMLVVLQIRSRTWYYGGGKMSLKLNFCLPLSHCHWIYILRPTLNAECFLYVH